MRRFQRIMKKFLFPKPAVIIFSVPTATALLIYTFAYEKKYSPVVYVSYALSAYALIIVCAGIIRMPKDGIKAALHRNKYVHRYLTDIPFKTHISLYLSLGLNLLFAAMKLFFGIWYGSVWFGTLAVYYIMLAVMRFLLLRHINRSSIGTKLLAEWQHYRLCGAILLLMNSALFGVVILVVRKNESFQYAGYLIYIVALYAFYNIITAVSGLVKYRKYKSPVMSASKAIKLAAALMSMLSLETAMLAQFGEPDNLLFRQRMTAMTGFCVCLIVFVTAVFMIVQSTMKLNRNGAKLPETEERK